MEWRRSAIPLLLLDGEVGRAWWERGSKERGSKRKDWEMGRKAKIWEVGRAARYP